MACIIDRPSPQVLFNRYRDMFSTTVLGGSPIIPESNEWYVVSLDYAVAEEFYSLTEQQWKERDPRYACCDNLIELARADGVYLRAASFSQGYMLVTGAAGTLMPATLEFTSNGKSYISSGTILSVMPATGRMTVLFRSVDPGSQGGVDIGATGTLTGAIAGLNSTVTIFGSTVCAGRDQETCEEFRARYLERKTYQPRATDAWLQQKLLEWPCVTRVCRRGGNCCVLDDECSCADCPSKIQYYVFFDNTFDCGLAPQCVVDEITDWLFGDPQGYGLGQVEIGVCGSIHTAVAAPIDITIDAGACVTPAQQTEIKEQIAGLFKTICPSETFYLRNIELIVASVVGPGVNFDVIAASSSTGVTLDLCSIDPACDVMPCLNSVEFVGAQDVIGACV